MRSFQKRQVYDAAEAAASRLLRNEQTPRGQHVLQYTVLKNVTKANILNSVDYADSSWWAR
jgi:hypothetical protein